MAGLDLATGFSTLAGIPSWLLIILMIWTIVWKGTALWKSAKLNHLLWFILILLINTFGILEILYIFVFSKMKYGQTNKERPIKTKKRR